MPSESHSRKLPKKKLAAEPVHLQLAKLCRDSIHDGTFQPGDRFPSERELAERYGISRATANKVISALITEGLLELQKGIGTQVRSQRRLFASLLGMESFTAHAREQGLEPSTEVQKFRRLMSSAAPVAVREGLELAKGENEALIYLERVRLADGVPMILEHRWVRESLAPDLKREDVAESFYRVLEEKYRLPMTGERHTISAVILNDRQAELMKSGQPSAALLVRGTGFVKSEEPLWYQELFYRGDRYELQNETRGAASSAIALRIQESKRSA